MSSNYPPDVTGFELQIAELDYGYEKEFDLYPCPKCGGHLLENGYHYDHWVSCLGDGPEPDCDFQRDLEPWSEANYPAVYYERE